MSVAGAAAEVCCHLFVRFGKLSGSSTFLRRAGASPSPGCRGRSSPLSRPRRAIASVGTQEPMVRRLFPGGNWIRTSGPRSQKPLSKAPAVMGVELAARIHDRVSGRPKVRIHFPPPATPCPREPNGQTSGKSQASLSESFWIDGLSPSDVISLIEGDEHYACGRYPTRELVRHGALRAGLTRQWRRSKKGEYGEQG